VSARSKRWFRGLFRFDSWHRWNHNYDKWWYEIKKIIRSLYRYDGSIDSVYGRTDVFLVKPRAPNSSSNIRFLKRWKAATGRYVILTGPPDAVVSRSRRSEKMVFAFRTARVAIVGEEQSTNIGGFGAWRRNIYYSRDDDGRRLRKYYIATSEYTSRRTCSRYTLWWPHIITYPVWIPIIITGLTGERNEVRRPTQS